MLLWRLYLIPTPSGVSEGQLRFIIQSANFSEEVCCDLCYLPVIGGQRRNFAEHVDRQIGIEDGRNRSIWKLKAASLKKTSDIGFVICLHADHNRCLHV